MDSFDRTIAREQTVADLCRGARSYDENVWRHPRLAAFTAEALTTINPSEYGGSRKEGLEHYLTERVRPIVRKRGRETYGFALWTFLMLAILSGVISAVVRH